MTNSKSDRNVSRFIWLAACLAFVVGFAALADRPVGHAAADENVKIVNTASSPVPVVVQGTQTFTGAVQSQQSGPWNVGIIGTPSVRRADEPGRSPYQSGFRNIAFPAGESSFDLELSFEQIIPDGATAVIEHVSASSKVPAPEFFSGTLVCQAPGTPEIQHAVSFEEQKGVDILGNTLRVASQAIKCYASHGGLHFVVKDLKQPESFAIFVSGYLVQP